MHTYFHYGDQSPLALQVSLRVICVFCVLAHVLSSKNPFASRFQEKVHQIRANETKLLNDCVCGRENMHTFFHYGDQSPLALVSLGIICVFCVLAHVLSSKTLLPFVFRKTFDCVWEEKTCIPFSIMKTNHHLHWCHWGSFVCLVFSYMFCRHKTFLPFVFQEKLRQINANETISYLMLVCVKTKHVNVFPFRRPITNCITSVIGFICYMVEA